MAPHEEYLELCAAATAGELTAEEQARLDAHLASCSECRSAMQEYKAASLHGIAAAAAEFAGEQVPHEDSWSVEDAERDFLRRLETENRSSGAVSSGQGLQRGQRFTYRPSRMHWREVWMSLAAVVLLSLAVVFTVYRTGVKHGTDVARTNPAVGTQSESSLEAQASDVGYERAQLQGKLEEDARVIADLKRQLAEQIAVVNSLKSGEKQASRGAWTSQPLRGENRLKDPRDGELAAAQTKLADLQKTVEVATKQREETARQAAVLEAKVNELTDLLQERERALDRTEAEVARGQDLLEHDRDIRDLMGARDLYMADVHDVSGRGMEKTYGRVFYTKGKRLIFYAFDLDAQPGVQSASSFQAWGRRGPDKQQAHSLGIFYEDNVSKKRWVLKADDPKSLEDIDAVFVTVEPNGGSQHPSGKPMLFAYLRISPNHP